MYGGRRTWQNLQRYGGLDHVHEFNLASVEHRGAIHVALQIVLLRRASMNLPWTSSTMLKLFVYRVKTSEHLSW